VLNDRGMDAQKIVVERTEKGERGTQRGTVVGYMKGVQKDREGEKRTQIKETSARVRKPMK